MASRAMFWLSWGSPEGDLRVKQAERFAGPSPPALTTLRKRGRAVQLVHYEAFSLQYVVQPVERFEQARRQGCASTKLLMQLLIHM